MMSEFVGVPDVSQDEIMAGYYGEMIMALTTIAVPNEKALLTMFGEKRGRAMPEAVGAMAHANICRMAWSLASAAEIRGAAFDPVAFGRTAERIAREQLQKYQAATQTAGRA